jgi:glycosyltransferase involved in cell wall biosynthesis
VAEVRWHRPAALMQEPRQNQLLFFSPLLAMPSQHGGCVYPHALLTELSKQGWSVDYAWVAAPLRSKRPVMRNPLAASYIRRGWMMGATIFGRFIVWTPRWKPRRMRPPVGHWFAKFGGEHLATEEEKLFASSVIRRVRPSRVLIDSTPMLTLLDNLTPAERSTMKVAVLTHNLTHRRAELYRQFGQPLDFLPMTEQEEADLLRRADIIVAIQDREAEAFRKMVPERKVVTVPMPFQPQPVPVEAEKPGQCLFVGGYSGHNIEAVRWLLSQVWPQVLAAVPSARLVIAGTVCRAIPQAPAGVELRGPVDNLKAEYAAASVCLVPLPLGTGLKIKLVEAMSYGRPVVTTTAGAEGFKEVEAGTVTKVADGAENFAAATIELLTSANARIQIVDRQTSWLRKHLNPTTALSPLVGM